MVTVNSMLGEYSSTGEFEFKGLSTDRKPTGTFGGKTIGDNSLFLELDTGDIYYYNGGSWSVMSTGGGSGGAGLPAVTTSDEGKILQVNSSGEWDKGDAPTEPLIVTATESGGVVTLTDSTLKDIYDARQAGRIVILSLAPFDYFLTGAMMVGSDYAIAFHCIKPDINNYQKLIASCITIGGSASTTTGGTVLEADLTLNT